MFVSGLVIIRGDGGLYADVTAALLDLPKTTSTYGVYIKYPAAIWREMENVFLEVAKSTCPVRTGYLRMNIRARSDNGGVEFWSDAPYSVYQEYGTSRQSGTPYFENAMNQAIYGSGAYDKLQEINRDFNTITRDLASLKSTAASNPDGAMKKLDYLRAQTMILATQGCDVSTLIRIIEQLKGYILQIDMIQEQYKEIQKKSMIPGPTKGKMGGKATAPGIMIIPWAVVFQVLFAQFLTDLPFVIADAIMHDDNSSSEHYPIGY